MSMVLLAPAIICQFVLIYISFVFHQGKFLDIYDYLAHSPQMGPDSEAFNC